MKGLFFIQSPLQLLTAYEAIHDFKIDKPYFIIRYSDIKENNIQLDFLIKFFSLEEKILLKPKIPSRRNLLYVAKILAFFLKMRKINFKYFDIFFLGDFSSKVSQILDRFFIRDKERVFLLDDGVATLYIQNFLFSPHFFRNLYTFFSSLQPFPGQIIYYHSFQYLKQFLLSKQSNLRQKKISLILGQPLVEKQIISLDNYLKTLKFFTENFDSNTEYIYIPHRKENSYKIEKVKQYLGFKIKTLSYPVELFPICEGYLPKYVVSFASTALISLNKLYHPKLQVFSLKISPKMLLKHPPHLEEIYKAFSYEKIHL